MKQHLSKQNRALLSELVRTDFKLRYQGSVLGYIWSLLRPLLLFTILYLVFVKFLRLGSGVPNFPIYLLLGIVLWMFFNDITNQGLKSIVGRVDLIRKVRIPRWLIVVSSSVSALINLTLNLLVVLIFLLLSGVDLLLTGFWLPVVVLEVFLLGIGLSLILATAYVKYRDISYIWEIILQAGFYITPILYPLSLIPEGFFQKTVMLNPLAQAIQDARYALVTHQTDTISSVYGNPMMRLVPILICLVLLGVGILYFKKQAKHFAEDI